MLATLACVAEEPSPLPFDANARAVILVRADGSLRDVFAFDVEDPSEFALRLDPEAEGELFLSVHASSLAELGLRPGPQAVAAPGEQAHPIPRPARAYAAARDEGRLTWQESAAARAEVVRTWLRGEPRRTRACPEISVRAFRMELGPSSKRWISVAQHLGGGRVLVGTEHGEWLIATRDGLERVATLTASVAHASGFRDEDGRIWLAQCEEEGLFSMTSALEYDRPVSQRCGSWTSGGSQVVRMEGAPHGTSRELVTMTRGGRVTFWDEARRGTTLYDLERQVIYQWVAWVAPGRAVVTLAEHALLFVRPDQRAETVRPDWLERDAPPKFYRARRLPEGLAVAGEDGAGKGLVMVQEPSSGAWFILGRTESTGALYQLVPTAEGFAFAGQTRQLGWWTQETGFCMAPDFGPVGPGGRPAWELGPHSFYVAVPVSEDEMFVGGFVTLSDTADTVWWVRRQR